MISANNQLFCSLQVNFNEPISMLQRLSEDLEYHELLDKASKCQSSLEQMCYVAAFSVSSYSTTVHRTGKPFNPLLGETYELDRRRESGYRSLCEQVRETETQRDGELLTRKWNWANDECQEGWVEKSHWFSILRLFCFLFFFFLCVWGSTCYRELEFIVKQMKSVIEGWLYHNWGLEVVNHTWLYLCVPFLFMHVEEAGARGGKKEKMFEAEIGKDLQRRFQDADWRLIVGKLEWQKGFYSWRTRKNNQSNM